MSAKRLQLFTSKQEEKEETPSPFSDFNGRALLEELISTFGARYDIPIRSYTSEELITATNNFHDVADFADKRNYGDWYKGSINERQILVKTSNIDTGVFSHKDIIRDIAVTSQMSRLKNVLKLSGCCLELENPALVHEYAECESLDMLLHHRETSVPWRNRIDIAIGIANAVLYLHTSFHTPIIHRNLSPTKVVIDQDGVAKLIDFSWSISLPLGESKVKDEVSGTIGFLDPEYLKSSFVTQKSDVYSFGVILLILLTGQQAAIITSSTAMSIIEYVKDHMKKNLLSQIIDPKLVNQGFDQQQWQSMMDLGISCTHFKGKDRPEMIEVAKELRRIDKCVHC